MVFNKFDGIKITKQVTSMRRKKKRREKCVNCFLVKNERENVFCGGREFC